MPRLGRKAKNENKSLNLLNTANYWQLQSEKHDSFKYKVSTCQGFLTL